MRGVKPSALGGLGLGLLYFVLEVAEVPIPNPILVVLGVVAVGLILYAVIGWFVTTDDETHQRSHSVKTGRGSTTRDIYAGDVHYSESQQPAPDPESIDVIVSATQPVSHSYVVTKQHSRVETITVPHLTIEQRSDYAPLLEFRLHIKGDELTGDLMNEVYTAAPHKLPYYLEENPKVIPGGAGQVKRHLGFATHDVRLRSASTATLRFRDLKGEKERWWELEVPGSVSTKR